MQETLSSTFYQRASQLKDAPAVRFKEGRSAYRDLSWTLFSRMVKEMGAGLLSFGFQPKGRAAIFSQTSHLWVASDIAIISAGGISVPVYPTSSQSDLEYILKNSESHFVFVQNESLLKKVLAVREKVPFLKKIILLSTPAGGKSLSEVAAEPGFVIGLEELQEAGREYLEKNPTSIEERVEGTVSSDLATIIYTSGTTGTPKGVGLSHDNILSVLRDLSQFMPITAEDVYLSFLPLSHVFERVCGEFYWLYSGGVNAFAEGIEYVGKNMQEVQPTMILVVPRVLDRIFAKVRSGIESSPPMKKKLIKWAINVGTEVVYTRARGEELSGLLSFKLSLADKLVLKKLRDKIGTRLRMVVSGGAPASAEVIEFFNAVGIDTFEGYGLTETTAPASVNRHHKVKPGTVGPPLPSVEARIAEDGEILLRGTSVFKGYYKNDDATREVFSDGWFHTGDIGTLDKDGYITITDRKKDLIVNSAGKNIAPQRIEAIIKTIPIVSQAIVFGDKKKHLVALLTLEETATTEFAREQGWEFEDFHGLTESPQLQQYLRKEINARSGDLAEYERVRNIAILPQDLSVEAGELTATLKIKRNVVAKKYKSLVDSLYREDEALVAGKR